MNPKIKSLWTTALRSGNYVQGSGHLFKFIKDQPLHCCLGVLTDIYIKETGLAEWVDDPSIDGDMVKACKIGPTRDRVVLPFEVIDWAGIQYANPILKFNGTEKSLSSLNDFEGQSFGDIADLIDNQL